MDALEFHEGELERRLDQLVETAAQAFDVTAAGIMLIDESGQLRLIGASDETGRALELVQEQTGTGPGIQATRRNSVVAVPDLEHDERWPLIRADLVPKGVLSVLSAPVRVHDRPAGTLNLFDSAPQAWTQADRSGLVAFAGVASALLRIAIEAQHGGELVRRLNAQLTPEGADGD